MMLEAIVLSLVVAFVRKGNIRRLGELDLRYTWLIFVPAVMMALLYTKRIHGMEFMGAIAPAIHAAAYLVILCVILLNKHLPGIALIGLGAALNFAVISANGGQMPVSVAAVKCVHMEKDLRTDMTRHRVMDDKTRLRALGDIIPLRMPPLHGRMNKVFRCFFPSIPGVMSVGDGVLSIGLFMLVQFGAVPGKKQSLEPKTEWSAGG